MKMPKYFVCIIVLFCLFMDNACAYELDMSVDEEIKKKYNTSQLNYDVPNLPKVAPSKSVSTPVSTLNYDTTKPQITKVDNSNALKISGGTKFRVKSSQAISSSINEGAVVSFLTTEPVYKKTITIPVGTKITAVVADSHRPQITGNGGLIVLRLVGITYKGNTYSLVGKVTKANSKKIFLNNIKGKRRYWQGVSRQIDKGENFYKKTRSVSAKMSNNPITTILSPIPTIFGALGYCVCAVASPITAIPNKGDGISIPAGSAFELKLTQDAFVY